MISGSSQKMPAPSRMARCCFFVLYHSCLFLLHHHPVVRNPVCITHCMDTYECLNHCVRYTNCMIDLNNVSRNEPRCATRLKNWFIASKRMHQYCRVGPKASMSSGRWEYQCPFSLNRPSYSSMLMKRSCHARVCKCTFIHSYIHSFIHTYIHTYI